MAEANHLYAIAIGSNRRHIRHGRPAGVIEAAIARLDAEFCLFDASTIILNKAVGGAGRDFANAVALVESTLAPEAMLSTLKALEREFGRRPGRRWGERVLDLDIAAWSGGRFRRRGLIIPHPRLTERAFVIEPLASVAPRWRYLANQIAAHAAARLGKRRPCR